MRSAFAEQLVRLEREIVDALDDAANTLATVAATVQEPSGGRVAAIAGEARKLRAQASSAYADLVTVTARQTPVASDLRLVLAMIDLAQHITLIANQFELISQQLAEVDPLTIDREQTGERLVRMSGAASAQLRKATSAFRSRDLESARELDRDDDTLDALNLEIANTVTRLDVSAGERGLGFHHVLIARSLERIGDNAVDIAEQAEFVITAERRQFSDASRPRTRTKTGGLETPSEDLS
jgi:phosphate transport system protein